MAPKHNSGRSQSTKGQDRSRNGGLRPPSDANRRHRSASPAPTSAEKNLKDAVEKSENLRSEHKSCPKIQQSCSRRHLEKSTETIEDALKQDDIERLPRAHPDVLFAREHLAMSYFDLHDFRRAETIYRQVLEAREASDDQARLRASARRSVLASLRNGLYYTPQAMLKGRTETALTTEAVELALKNVKAFNNPRVAKDLDYWVHFRLAFFDPGVNLPAYVELLQEHIRLISRYASQDKDAQSALFQSRLELMKAYTEGLHDRKGGGAIYKDIKASLRENEKYVAIDTSFVDNKWRKHQKALDTFIRGRWKAVLVRLAATAKTVRQKWYGLLKRVLARIRWKSVLEHARSVAKKKIRQRRKSGLRKRQEWRRIVSHALSRHVWEMITLIIKLRSYMARRTPRVMLYDSVPGYAIWVENSKAWIERFAELRKDLIGKTFDENVRRVRITIIDTGIDSTHPFIKKNWHNPEVKTSAQRKPSLFRDFTVSDPDKQPDPVDVDGHGTFIAGLILQLVPDVELSVARIIKDRKSMNDDKQLEEKIGKAINHAIDAWDTEIISISFGLDGKSKRVQPALKRAVLKNGNPCQDTIILAAAGNYGNQGDVSYPANAFPQIFKIFAATSYGWPDHMNPPAAFDTQYCFAVLGIDIPSTWPSKLKDNAENAGFKIELRNENETWTTMSGTSFATPIAASLVALLYQLYNDNPTEIKRLIGSNSDGLKSNAAIRAVLLKMSRSGGGHDRPHILNPFVGNDNYFRYRGTNKGSFPAWFAKRVAESIFNADV